jgi:hypothetical protein
MPGPIQPGATCVTLTEVGRKGGHARPFREITSTRVA